MNKNKSSLFGFTLAETMIVLAVLGIISLIVIPQIIQKFNGTSARMKIKKAMSVYDHLFAKMILEQGHKSGNALVVWVENVDCRIFVDYFKPKANGNNACAFKNSENLWWDVSNVTEPIVATSKKALEAAQKSGTDGKTSFKLVASYDDLIGNYRINDITYERKRLDDDYRKAENKEDKNVIKQKYKELEKLFGYIYPGYDGQPVCKKILSMQCIKGGPCYEYKYDEKGNKIYERNCYNGNCSSKKYEYDNNGEKIINYKYCNGNGENCTYTVVYDYEGDNLKSMRKCDLEGNTCDKLIAAYRYDNNGNKISYYKNCSSLSSDSCGYSERYDYDNDGKLRGYQTNEKAGYNTNPTGGYYKYEYDDNGNIAAEKYCSNPDANYCIRSTVYEYDEYNNKTTASHCGPNKDQCSINPTKYENTYTEICY